MVAQVDRRVSRAVGFAARRGGGNNQGVSEAVG